MLSWIGNIGWTRCLMSSVNYFLLLESKALTRSMKTMTTLVDEDDYPVYECVPISSDDDDDYDDDIEDDEQED